MNSLETAIGEMVSRGKIVEGIIAAKNPELLQTYLTYQNEALAARKFLDSSLIELKDEARILEVGGGYWLFPCNSQVKVLKSHL
jgi:hypothetical protein